MLRVHFASVFSNFQRLLFLYLILFGFNQVSPPSELINCIWFCNHWLCLDFHMRFVPTKWSILLADWWSAEARWSDCITSPLLPVHVDEGRRFPLIIFAIEFLLQISNSLLNLFDPIVQGVWCWLASNINYFNSRVGLWFTWRSNVDEVYILFCYWSKNTGGADGAPLWVFRRVVWNLYLLFLNVAGADTLIMQLFGNGFDECWQNGRQICIDAGRSCCLADHSDPICTFIVFNHILRLNVIFLSSCFRGA